MPKLVILLALSLFGTAGGLAAPANAASENYQVTAFPFYSQEGSTITIVLSVRNAMPSTTYSFNFSVRDPSTTIWTSNPQIYITLAFETEFGLIILFPSPEFPCRASCPSTSLVGTYLVGITQILPSLRPNVAQTWFFVGLTDRYLPYQRTETVSIVATGYSPSESVSIAIRTSVSLTLVYSHTVLASTGGRVNDSWYVPKNATVTEDYIVTLTGTVTSKNPADAQSFTVQAAVMSISALSSSKTTYQRTETFSISFQPVYPSGEIANTGLALITLTRPDRANRTLTATYNSTTQTFIATYKTTTTNQTGTWTASLPDYGYDDGFGNIGPSTILTNSPQLQPATLTVSIIMKNTFAASEQIKFNATIQYPDGTLLTSGNVSSTLSLTGGGYTTSVPVAPDTSLNLWIGVYNPRGDEPSGLWSLTVTASDSAQPANSGSSVKAIQIQNRPPGATFTGSTNSVLTGVAVSFDATSSSDPDGAIVGYLWDFGDGSTGSGVSTNHSYANSGTYTVRLTVTDNLGATASATYTVTVTAAPQSGENVSFPLYYFGIIAGALAAALGGAFFAFRRHKVTHARLKIDLEAVRTEAGRIENQEFFQSVKDQLKKDKDD